MKRPNRTTLLSVVLVLALVTLAGAASVGARATAAPVNTGEPSITGTAIEGSTLTASPGTWTSTTAITYTAQWVRCDQNGGNSSGTNCATITGATGQFYELKSADVGFRLRIRVTATNNDGSTTVASNPTAIVQAKAPATTKPTNTQAPAISGTPVVDSIVKASTGTWTGTQPITYAYTWAACNTSGGNCSAIQAAGGSEYLVRSSDAGKTLRVQVSATNSAGSTNAVSNQTAVVQLPSPAGIVQLPSGERSIPATSVTGAERLVISNVAFSPNPVTSRDQPINVRIRVKDTRGYVVRGAIVFIRSTPRLTTGGDQQTTELDGWISYSLTPLKAFPLKNGQNVQFFVRAYRSGDPLLAGVSNRRLVQVATRG